MDIRKYLSRALHCGFARKKDAHTYVLIEGERGCVNRILNIDQKVAAAIKRSKIAREIIVDRVKGVKEYLYSVISDDALFLLKLCHILGDKICK